MEDSPIKDLEDAAIGHSDCLGEIREKRAELKKIKTELVTLMRALGKKSYNHAGIVLKLREGEDDVSVKVKRHDREDQGDDEPGEGDPPPEIGGDEEEQEA